MTGVKLGDRVLQIGCAHGGRLAAIAAKVGLSGRVMAIVPDAARAGVLVETTVAPLTRLPADDAAFDLVIVDDVDGSFGALPAEDRDQTIRDAARVVRPGGRAMVIGATPRQGLSALFWRRPSGASLAASGRASEALETAGFRGVRTLAEREGLVFIEGIKPRQAPGGESGRA